MRLGLGVLSIAIIGGVASLFYHSLKKDEECMNEYGIDMCRDKEFKEAEFEYKKALLDFNNCDSDLF